MSGVNSVEHCINLSSTFSSCLHQKTRLYVIHKSGFCVKQAWLKNKSATAYVTSHTITTRMIVRYLHSPLAHEAFEKYYYSLVMYNFTTLKRGDYEKAVDNRA